MNLVRKSEEKSRFGTSVGWPSKVLECILKKWGGIVGWDQSGWI
jgi:hypothetical protein